MDKVIKSLTAGIFYNTMTGSTIASLKLVLISQYNIVLLLAVTSVTCNGRLIGNQNITN